MKNVSTLFIALSLVTLAGCPGDDGGSDGTETATPSTMTDPTGTAGDDGTPTAGDDDGVDDGVDTTAGMDDGGDDGGEMACVHTCAADADCAIAGNQTLSCDNGTCTFGCTEDASCVALFSGWGATPCTMGGGECELTMQVCVDLGDGTGGCAFPAEGGAIDCATAMLDEVEATNLDDGAPVTVCGNGDATCNTDNGNCELPIAPCVDDTTCGELTCDTASGECVCTEDAQCGEGGTCNADGTCTVPGCMTDADCDNPFDGGTVACQ